MFANREWAEDAIKNIKAELWTLDIKIKTLEYDCEIQRKLACVKCMGIDYSDLDIALKRKYASKKTLLEFLDDIMRTRGKIEAATKRKNELEETLQKIEFELEFPFSYPSDDELTEMFNNFEKEFSYSGFSNN
ncbi:MAG: hypothetical protein AB7U45_03770 [Desulfamplus sp.]